MKVKRCESRESANFYGFVQGSTGAGMILLSERVSWSSDQASTVGSSTFCFFVPITFSLLRDFTLPAYFFTRSGDLDLPFLVLDTDFFS